MKLSRLVAYLNHLEQFDISKSGDAVTPYLDPLIHTVTSHELQFANISQQLIGSRERLQDELHNFKTIIEALKIQIAKDIESLEPFYLKQSYQLYSDALQYDTTQQILDRQFALTKESETYLQARLLRHSDWHHPAMIIRPGRETWIQNLVALDPLYLVDLAHELMLPAMQYFPKEYQNRLRCYVIKEQPDRPWLDILPQNQMALVLAYNFFHLRPLEVVRQYFTEIFSLLKPGGYLCCTFNNCDRAGAVELAERMWTCYTPGRLILPAAQMAGFEIAHTYDIDAAVTWLELKKPGSLVSNRGGQALAKIVAKRGNK